MIEVLLVEDDPVLGRGLSVSLEIQGYHVHWARSLKEATQAREKVKPALILLDLGLPDGNGLDFLRTIRETDARTPVVILTAQSDEDSVVEGLQSGANDYVRKPFGNKELLARLKTALHEPQAREHQIRYGDLMLLLDKRKVVYGEKEVELNRREFDILSYLVQHAEAVVTRESLLSSLDKDGEIFDRTVDSHISHLRTRLKQAGVSTLHISSVYGVGYRLEKS
jgi:two-component system, OmpR family, response regulator